MRHERAGHGLVLAALYTSPGPARAELAPARCKVKAGPPRLTVQLPQVESHDNHGRVFTFRHLVQPEGPGVPAVPRGSADRPDAGGDCRVTIAIIETTRWDGFGLLLFFEKDHRRTFCFRHDRLVAAGSPPATIVRSESRALHPADHLVARPRGLGQPTPELPRPSLTDPTATSYRAVVFKGTKDSLQYRILLPVSQQ